MSTYRKTGRIVSVMLLLVFIFAALQPVRSYSPYKSSRVTFQNHIENLAVSFIPDWQTAFPAENYLMQDIIWKTVRVSKSFGVNANTFTYFLNIPTINAP